MMQMGFREACRSGGFHGANCKLTQGYLVILVPGIGIREPLREELDHPGSVFEGILRRFLHSGRKPRCQRNAKGPYLRLADWNAVELSNIYGEKVVRNRLVLRPP